MHIYSYKIAIASPILPFSQRRGLIFETENGWGEAAPLPGRSRETIEDLMAAPHNSPYDVPRDLSPKHFHPFLCALWPQIFRKLNVLLKMDFKH
jgi:hypothetical protein